MFDGTTLEVTSIAGKVTTKPEISSGNYVENFVGSSTGDVFVFNNGATIEGSIDGKSGDDTLSFSNFGSPLNFVLTEKGSLSGFQGEVMGVIGAFDNIEDLIGSVLSGDSLLGMDATALWQITTGIQDIYSVDLNTLTFAGIESLIGGNGADTFQFADGATHVGSLDGGEGSDELDYQSYSATIVVDLSNHMAEGVSGGVVNFENVTGGSGNDTITGDEFANHLNGSGGNDTLYGLGGNDVLVGGDGNDTLFGGLGDDRFCFGANWGVDQVHESIDQGSDWLDFSTVTDDLMIDLSNMNISYAANLVTQPDTFGENIQAGSGDDLFMINTERHVSLFGGPGADQFVFSDGVLLTGNIDGQAGEDILDLSAYATPRLITLMDIGDVDGFKGLEASINGFFTNVDTVIGTGSASDEFTGANGTAVFDLSGDVNYQMNGHSMLAEDFEILHGGSGSDTFIINGDQSFDLFGGTGNDTFLFMDMSSLVGIIDGQAGTNTLNYTDYTSGLIFNLKGLGSLTGFTGNELFTLHLFTNINDIIGGSEDDVLSGLNSAGVWEIIHSGTYTSQGRTLTWDSIESLNGSGMNDTFIFRDGATMAGSIDGRGGTDTLDFSNYTTGIIATLQNGFVNVIFAGVTSIENIVGGSGNDSLTGNDKNNVLDGGAGDDILSGLGGDDTLYAGLGTNILYGGDGYDTGIILPESVYSVPLNDIENWTLLKPDDDIPDEDIPEKPGQEAKPVIVPVTSGDVFVIPVITGQKVQLLAEGYLAIILVLPEGNQAFFGFLNGEIAGLAYFDIFTLPDELPEDTRMLFGIEISLSENGVPDRNDKVGMTISFMVPQGFNPKDLVVAFWDEEQEEWVEINSIYIPFLEVTTDDCLFSGFDKNGFKNCLYTRWNHTGSIGQMMAFAKTAGLYALLIKGQETDLSCSENALTVELSTGAMLTTSCGQRSTLVTIPVAVWNVLPVADIWEPISALAVYKKDAEGSPSGFESGAETTVSFPLHENVPSDQQFILFWDEIGETWVELQNTLIVDGRIEAQIDQAGTYMLVMRKQ